MRVRLFIAAALIAVLAVGCGGGGSSSSTKSANPNGSSKGAKDGSEPSAEFLGPSENGQLAKLGKESDPAEREAASQILEESLQARADGDWEAQCETLAAPLIKAIEKTAALSGAGKGCENALEAQAAPASESVRASTLTGPIDALRVEGKQAFAFWHGTEGKDYVIPMEKEGGEWKVGALAEQEV